MSEFVQASGDIIVVPPGIAIHSTLEGAIPVDTDSVGALQRSATVLARFRLEYSLESGRYEIASFGLDRGDAAVEISGALWRTVRVHSIVRTAIEFGLPGWTLSIPKARFRRRARKLPNAPDYQPSDADGLLLAALAYRIAEITGENPALAVAETLGLKQRTATNWITRARASGFLSSVEHEDAARRIAGELDALMGFTYRPSVEEEAMRLRAIEISVVRSWREFDAGRLKRRAGDGND